METKGHKGKSCLKKIRWSAIDEDSSRPQGRAGKRQNYLQRKLRSAAGSVQEGAIAHLLSRFFADSGPCSAERLQGAAAAWSQLSPTGDRTTSARAAEAEPGTTLPSVPGGRGAAGRAQAPSQQAKAETKEPGAAARTLAHRARAHTEQPCEAAARDTRTRRSPRRLPHGAEADPESECLPGPAWVSPRGPQEPGRTAWEGRGHWGGRGADRPAQVRRASAGSGCLEPRGDPIRSCPFQDEPRTPGAGARGVARLSRGVCIPAGPGLALQRAACVPYQAVRPHSVPGALLAVFAPRAPGEDREGVVGLRPLFSERGAGSFWALQSAGAQWEERTGNARLGPRSQQKALAPAILVVLHAAATSGHIAVLRT